MKKLVRLMFWTIDERNVHFGNALDRDLKITLLLNVQIHHKIMINREIKYILMKSLIVDAKTEKITVTKRHMHLWHDCLAITNVQVKIMVTVHNLPIGFWILEQRATSHQNFRFHFRFIRRYG